MVGRWLARTLDAGCSADPAPADVLIVLAGGLAPGGAPARSTHQRVRAAARLWKAGLAPLVLLSGGRLSGGVNEARAMARAAVAEGIPPGRLLLEEHSLNTFENARFSAALMRAKDLRSALLVTCPSHLKRSLAVFRNAGIRQIEGFRDPLAVEDLYRPARELVAVALYRLLAFM